MVMKGRQTYKTTGIIGRIDNNFLFILNKLESSAIFVTSLL